MEYVGRLFAKIGNKYVAICHSNQFDEMSVKLQEQAKEIEELTRSRDDVFHELEGYKEHNNQLAKEIERLKAILKEISDELSDF
jgi:uncharacterized coiled-coil DUF342 family protein